MTRPHVSAEAAARRDRWAAPGRAKVTHPRFGSVVVPHCSALGATKNAAEYWGVHWLEISDAEVRAATPEDGRAVCPRDFIADAMEALKNKGEKKQ